DCSPWASAAGAVALGTGYGLWSQSTRVEVYSLHLLFGALGLLFALRYRRNGRLFDLLGAALAVSLGLAHHLTIVLLGPGLLVICLPRLRQDARLARRLLPAVAVLFVGPAFYAVLFFRARSGALQDWGHPATLSLLWNHASARFYHGYLHAPDLPRLRS